MERLKPALAQYGSKGLSFMRKSKFALQAFFKKHKTAVIIAAAVSAGAIAYATKESPKIQVPHQESDKVIIMIKK